MHTQCPMCKHRFDTDDVVLKDWKININLHNIRIVDVDKLKEKIANLLSEELDSHDTYLEVVSS